MALRQTATLECAETRVRRSWTLPRGLSLTATIAGLGWRARRSAHHWAVVAMHSWRNVRVDAFRRSSCETVDGNRPSRSAMSRISTPCARCSAMSFCSASDTWRPDTVGRQHPSPSPPLHHPIRPGKGRLDLIAADNTQQVIDLPHALAEGVTA